MAPERHVESRAAMESFRSKNQQGALFLSKLPAELRNRVYELVLVHPNEIAVNSRKRLRDHKALLQTCKQIREEASKIFYALNSFRITLPVHWKPRPILFFETAGFENSLSVRGLSVVFTPSREQRHLSTQWKIAREKLQRRAIFGQQIAPQHAVRTPDGLESECDEKLAQLRSDIRNVSDVFHRDLDIAGVPFDSVHVVLRSDKLPADRFEARRWTRIADCGKIFRESLYGSDYAET